MKKLNYQNNKCKTFLYFREADNKFCGYNSTEIRTVFVPLLQVYFIYAISTTKNMKIW